MNNRYIVVDGIRTDNFSNWLAIFVETLEEEVKKAGEEFKGYLINHSSCSQLGEEMVKIMPGLKQDLSPNSRALIAEALRLEALAGIGEILRVEPKSWVISAGGPDSDWAYIGHGSGAKLELLEDLELHRSGPEPVTTVFFEQINNVGADEIRDEDLLGKILGGYEEKVYGFLGLGYSPYYIINLDESDEQIKTKIQQLASSLAQTGTVPEQDFDEENLGFYVSK